MAKNEEGKQLRCSFCGKPQELVSRMIAGPGVCICNECIELCQSVLDDENDVPKRRRPARDEERTVVPTPEEIKAGLDEYVIGQDAAKVALSVAVYFVAVTVLSTLLELIVGLIFMKGLGIPLWSYKNFDHTFMDIICLDFSLLWGVLITVGMCTLWPFLQFLERKLSPKARAVAAIVLAVLVVCDFAFNVTYFAVTGLHFDLY